MAITYNNMIDFFRSISDAHYQIKNFGHGDLSEIEGDLKANEVYPKLWVSPVDSVTLQYTQNRTFQVFIFDLVHKDISNEDDVLSDTEQILNDVINILRQENDTISLANEPQLIPFREQHGDDLTGWMCEVVIQSELRSNYCDIPKSFPIAPIASGCDPGNNPDPVPSFDCDDLLGCDTIIEIEETLVDLQEQIDNLPPGAIYTSSNGITLTGNDFQLGGKLIETTLILGGANIFELGTSGSHLDSFSMYADNNILFNTSTGNIVMDADNGSISFDSLLHTNRGMDVVTNRTATNLFQIVEVGTTIANNGTNNTFIVTDNVSSKGIVYASDYSANFTPESLVTKRYVDNAAPNITATNGLTKILNDIQLGGTLLQATSILGASNSLSLGTTGSKLSSLNTYSTGSTVFTVGSGTATIDTSGSITISGDFNVGPNKGLQFIDGVLKSELTYLSNTLYFLGQAAGQTLITSFNNNIVYSGNSLGVQYGADYSATFVNESLITKRYADAAITTNSANTKKGSFGIGINKGSGLITTADTATLTMPCSGTITGWEIVEVTDTPIAGSIVLDIWKDTYANYQPTILDTITGSEKPTLSSATKNQNLTLTTWTTTFNAGDIFKFKVDSVSGAKNILLTIYYTKD